MRCKKVLDRLDDHVDGLLPACEAEAVRDHLDRCGECRETAQAVKASTDTLSAWSDEEPAPECFDRILARVAALPPESLEREPARSFFSMLSRMETPRIERVRWFATSGLAAAAAVLCAVSLAREPASRGKRPPAARVAAAPASMRSPGFFQGYEFDSDLLRGGRPALAPAVGTSGGSGLFERAPR
jgi:anti-sigma factor RsiW